MLRLLLAATQCPNGYEAIAENLEGTVAEWSQHGQAPQDCADTCDDRGGCTGFKYVYHATGYRGCAFYTGGDTNIVENESRDLSISEWYSSYSCIKGKCQEEA